MPIRDVSAPDGRTLRVHEAGDADGPAVVAHHGTPTDGALFGRWVADAEQRGIRLIGYDRPGYGGSDPHRERTVADAAADTAAIADALGVERFATWGISGGGPHALACAALLGERVVGAAGLAGVAPFEAAGLNFFAGMGQDNLAEFGAAMQGREALAAFAAVAEGEMTGAEPGDLVEAMRTLVSPVDAAALQRGYGAFWAANMAEVFKQGVEGWLDDDMAFVSPWGFAVDAIAVPVLIWHGHHDRFVPVSHGRWLAAAIPGSEARLTVDDGHITIIDERIPDVHAWLLRRFP